MSEQLYVPFGSGGPCPTAYAELSFEEVLARMVPRLRAIAKRLTQDRDLQDDLVQEGAIRLWEIDVTRFNLEDGTERSYLITSVANHMSNVVRAERVRSRAPVCRLCLLAPCSPERRLMCSVSGAAATRRRMPRSRAHGMMVATVFGRSDEQ